MDLETEIRRAVAALWDSHRVENEALQRAAGGVARAAVLTNALVPLLRLMHDISHKKPAPMPEDLRAQLDDMGYVLVKKSDTGLIETN